MHLCWPNRKRARRELFELARDPRVTENPALAAEVSDGLDRIGYEEIEAGGSRGDPTMFRRAIETALMAKELATTDYQRGMAYLNLGRACNALDDAQGAARWFTTGLEKLDPTDRANQRLHFLLQAGLARAEAKVGPDRREAIVLARTLLQQPRGDYSRSKEDWLHLRTDLIDWELARILTMEPEEQERVAWDELVALEREATELISDWGANEGVRMKLKLEFLRCAIQFHIDSDDFLSNAGDLIPRLEREGSPMSLKCVKSLQRWIALRTSQPSTA